MVRRLMGWGAVLLMTACGASTGPDVDVEGALLAAETEVTLQYGEELQVQGTVLYLVLAGVPEDSRCAVDVTCVWEGNAVVEVGVRVGSGPTVPLQMNSSLEPRSVRWQDLELTLVQLRPVPTSDGVIRVEDYSATLRLVPTS